jgi:hypothetical protein
VRWDEFLSDDVASESAGPLPLLPESQPNKPWVGEITEAAIAFKDFDWAKSEKNPDGKCLAVKIQVPNFRSVESTIPCHYMGKVAAMCRSARVHPPEAGEDWDEAQLVGQSVTFESVTVISAKGNEYARVSKWLPNTAPLPKVAKAPARTPAAKVEAAGQGGASDDIPF